MPPVALTAIFGLAWVAGHLAEVIVVSVTCGVLSVAVVVALMRWTERREARHAIGHPFLITRAEVVPVVAARVIPQVTGGTSAIENHYHTHFDPADREAAAIIRAALPGTAGDVSTGRK